MRLDINCKFCNKEKPYILAVTEAQVDAWERGMLIQQAMPNLSPEERDLFVLSMCLDCQKTFWSKFDD